MAKCRCGARARCRWCRHSRSRRRDAARAFAQAVRVAVEVGVVVGEALVGVELVDGEAARQADEELRRCLPSSTASTGVPRGAMMSSASWRRRGAVVVERVAQRAHGRHRRPGSIALRPAKRHPAAPRSAVGSARRDAAAPQNREQRDDHGRAAAAVASASRPVPHVDDEVLPRDRRQRRASQLVRCTQPFVSSRPTRAGSGVPWMPQCVLLRPSQTCRSDCSGPARSRPSVARVVVVQQRRIVRERRILDLVDDLHPAHRQRVVRPPKLTGNDASGAPSASTTRSPRSFLWMTIDVAFRRRAVGDVGNDDLVAGREARAAVEVAQQPRARVEALGERLLERSRSRATQPARAMMSAGMPRDGPAGVCVGHGVERTGGARRRRRSASQVSASIRPVGGRPRDCWNARPRAACSREAAVDLARREPRAIEQHLGTHDGGPCDPWARSGRSATAFSRSSSPGLSAAAGLRLRGAARTPLAATAKQASKARRDRREELMGRRLDLPRIGSAARPFL